MDRTLDELLKENEELKAEVQRLNSVLESNFETLDAMAEGIAMLSNPNWTEVTNKEELIQRVVIEWITRSGHERDHRKTR